MRAVFLRVFLFLSVFTSIVILSAPLLQAVEPVFVRESLRARGMGNAFTATANDEMLLFYNPAGLRSVSYNIYEVVGFNFTTNQSTQDLGNSSSGSATLGNLAGKKIYAEVNLGILSHINSRFGWSLFSGGLLDIQVRNPVFPYLELKSYLQTGIAGGMAWSFMDYQLDVGLGAKLIQRAGIDTKFHVFDEAIIEIQEESKTTKLEKKFSNKAAVAPDLGAIYHFDSVHNMEPKVAVSLQNIGGLDFEGAGKVPMTMNIGVSTESEVGGFDFIMAADYRDLSNSQNLVSEGNIITTRNLKLGAEMGWNRLFNGHHLFSLRAGRNGPYNSVGWSSNLFGFKIDFAKYSQEIGGYGGELEDKRTSIQVSLIF
ncbi:MAG: hypothetical protein HOI10_11685 [Deltaproteobacteria bacterium]|jgi:hypothetical protein|nr:hypothetical protein [Deltaproteobacteria bacterium]